MEIKRQAAQQAESEDAPAQPRRRSRPEFTPEQQVRIEKYNEEAREFRFANPGSILLTAALDNGSKTKPEITTSSKEHF